ncbi:imidazole glycerol phosphate synthase cyclase subunit [Candidatus Babeliales bacterium]|nr:imidazole glycerol phosphate synthase cyclase subunit [Candidatus Babeliales bacterium]
MLKIRVIPTLLWKHDSLIKGVNFDNSRKVGFVLPAIKVYNMRQVDELIFLDVTASLENKSPDFNLISDFSSECFVPLTVGGGIKSIEDIRLLLKAGADKVCINSITFKNSDFINQAAKIFGSQCIVVSIDVRKNSKNFYECYSHSGTMPTGKNLSDWIKEVEFRGAGEIIITSIDADGTMQGYDQELIKLVCQNVNIPVIASGGAGSYEHMYQAINNGANAVAAASSFHFTEQTPLEAKKYLFEKKILIRL